MAGKVAQQVKVPHETPTVIVERQSEAQRANEYRVAEVPGFLSPTREFQVGF